MDQETVVLWEEVDKVLPLQQDPASRTGRKALFKELLGKGHKLLTLDDVTKGMKLLLRHDMAASYVPGIPNDEMLKSIQFAFKVASELLPCQKKPKKSKEPVGAKVDCGQNSKDLSSRKSNGSLGCSSKSLSSSDFKRGISSSGGRNVHRRAFHAFIMAFRHYLEFAELFEICDTGKDHDHKLSCRECLKHKDLFGEWGISEEMVKGKFVGVDLWVAHMEFREFAEWVAAIRLDLFALKLDDSDDEEVLFEAASSSMKESVHVPFQELGTDSEMNKIKVQEVFEEWDTDHNGSLSCEELSSVLKALNPTFTDKSCKLLFDAADTNGDGLVDFEEFLAFVLA
jgi:hypothetical protein